jgi:ankyrin repeat protein
VKRFVLAVICAAAVAVPVLAQSQKDSLAGLIEAGNRKAALDKIRAGADVNEAQPDGTRPIHWAVYRVDYELMDALIAKKAKVNVINELGSTPLAEAVKLDDLKMVKMILDAGSGPEGANPDGETALMLAVKTGDTALVQMLVTAGANVNAVEKVQEQTPLMWAASANANAAEMVKILISKGANVKARAKYTDWPSQMTSEPRAQYHSYGGLTVLLYAARGGCYACVEALAAAGTDVNVPTPEGVTPLMIALDNNHNDVAKFFLDHGANPNFWDVYGRTALYIAIDKKMAGGGGGAPAGGRGGGAAPGARGGGGGNAGARGGGGPAVSSMDIVNALLAAGVDPNPQLNMRRPEVGSGGRFSDLQLSTGVTPLFRAVQNNDMEVIQALLGKGANPNISGMGVTPFLLAAGVGGGGGGGRGGGGGGGGGAVNTALLDLLIQHGADVNTQVTGTQTYSMRIARTPSNNEGTSALHTAVQGGRTEMVSYLLNHGASTELVDANGRKPIDLAGGGGGRGGGGGAAGAAGAAPALPAAAGAPAAGGGGRGAGGGGGNAASAAEIRTLLQNAAAKK